MRLPRSQRALYTAAMQAQAIFYRIGLAVALSISSVAGCNAQTGQSHAQQPGDSASTAVALKIADFDEVQKIVATHRGQVVVLDCWSTSCPPCIEEFPKLVALHRNYPSSKLACISLSFDFEGLGKPEDVQADVLKFLRSQNATFENLLGGEASDVLLKKMQLASIPAMFVYDQQGEVHRFEGSKAYDEAAALVKTLVEAP